MIRNIDLKEISDGKKYGVNDMVKADCQGCQGCSACCRGMGKSIVLDPFDIYQLTTYTNKTFEMLISHELELNVVDGLILPNLKMNESSGSCSFLNEEGRCSIHHCRPSICRIFPLGRLYENGDFQYILQVNECKKENKSKVKVRKWIDVKDIKQNEEFIRQWHYFIKEVQEQLAQCKDTEQSKMINLTILNLFFVQPYEKDEEFYSQFAIRFNQAKKLFM